MRYNIFNKDAIELMDEMILKGIKVDAIITDPPYGTTLAKWDKVIDIEKMWDRIEKIKRNEKTPVILFSSGKFTPLIQISNLKDFKYRITILKSQGTDFGNVKRKYLNATEDVNVFYKKQCIFNPQMEKGKPYYDRRKRSNIETMKKNGFKDYYVQDNKGVRFPLNYKHYKWDSKTGKSYHPTQKPILLMENLVKTFTNENDTILDFAMGSGTTGIAALKTNRKFIGVELDKEHFETANKRILNEIKKLG